jgi:3-oxoacyl-[acyl-carrier protein] reductase
MTGKNVPTYPDLRGKVALVTGGSGGIGAATCRLLAANGARVAVNGRDEDRIGATVEAIRAEGGEAVGAPADCTDPVAVEGMRRRTEEELGPVGILAAFVGGAGRVRDRLRRLPRRTGVRPSTAASPPPS